MKDLSRLLPLSSSAADDVAAMSLTCAPSPQDCGTLAEPPPFRKDGEAAFTPSERKRILALGGQRSRHRRRLRDQQPDLQRLPRMAAGHGQPFAAPPVPRVPRHKHSWIREPVSV